MSHVVGINRSVTNVGGRRGYGGASVIVYPADVYTDSDYLLWLQEQRKKRQSFGLGLTTGKIGSPVTSSSTANLPSAKLGVPLTLATAVKQAQSKTAGNASSIAQILQQYPVPSNLVISYGGTLASPTVDGTVAQLQSGSGPSTITSITPAAFSLLAQGWQKLPSALQSLALQYASMASIPGSVAANRPMLARSFLTFQNFATIGGTVGVRFHVVEADNQTVWVTSNFYTTAPADLWTDLQPIVNNKAAYYTPPPKSNLWGDIAGALVDVSNMMTLGLTGAVYNPSKNPVLKSVAKGTAVVGATLVTQGLVTQALAPGVAAGASAGAGSGATSLLTPSADSTLGVVTPITSADTGIPGIDMSTIGTDTTGAGSVLAPATEGAGTVLAPATGSLTQQAANAAAQNGSGILGTGLSPQQAAQYAQLGVQAGQAISKVVSAETNNPVTTGFIANTASEGPEAWLLYGGIAALVIGLFVIAK